MLPGMYSSVHQNNSLRFHLRISSQPRGCVLLGNRSIIDVEDVIRTTCARYPMSRIKMSSTVRQHTAQSILERRWIAANGLVLSEIQIFVEEYRVHVLSTLVDDTELDTEVLGRPFDVYGFDERLQHVTGTAREIAQRRWGEVSIHGICDAISSTRRENGDVIEPDTVNVGTYRQRPGSTACTSSVHIKLKNEECFIASSPFGINCEPTFVSKSRSGSFRTSYV